LDFSKLVSRAVAWGAQSESTAGLPNIGNVQAYEDAQARGEYGLLSASLDGANADLSLLALAQNYVALNKEPVERLDFRIVNRAGVFGTFWIGDTIRVIIPQLGWPEYGGVDLYMRVGGIELDERAQEMRIVAATDWVVPQRKKRILPPAQTGQPKGTGETIPTPTGITFDPDGGEIAWDEYPDVQYGLYFSPYEFGPFAFLEWLDLPVFTLPDPLVDGWYEITYSDGPPDKIHVFEPPSGEWTELITDGTWLEQCDHWTEHCHVSGGHGLVASGGGGLKLYEGDLHPTFQALTMDDGIYWATFTFVKATTNAVCIINCLNGDISHIFWPGEDGTWTNTAACSGIGSGPDVGIHIYGYYTGLPDHSEGDLLGTLTLVSLKWKASA
jgi:hypothetical protein